MSTPNHYSATHITPYDRIGEAFTKLADAIKSDTEYHISDALRSDLLTALEELEDIATDQVFQAEQERDDADKERIETLDTLNDVRMHLQDAQRFGWTDRLEDARRLLAI